MQNISTLQVLQPRHRRWDSCFAAPRARVHFFVEK